jgi:hypothetical protein
MIFYSLLSFFVGPFIGKKINNSVSGVQTGLFAGVAASLLLWFWKGKDLVAAYLVSSSPQL